MPQRKKIIMLWIVESLYYWVPALVVEYMINRMKETYLMTSR